MDNSRDKLQTEFSEAELRAIRAVKNKQLREWRKQHPDKVREYNNRSLLKKAREQGLV